ncbi:MAG: carbohydrate kinase [Bacteroidetes bacterium]|nr:carbohydrate kinase [Bacteroidota bacterium]
MRKIYAIGETLYDIIFQNNQPKASKPGGAMLNTAVTLGRLRLPVNFISEYSDDPVGEKIETFLEENHVQTDHIYRYHDGQTAISLAFLDKDNNASYTFYKSYPPERLNIRIPEFQKDDILIFGSFFALNSDVRKKLLDLLQKASDQGAIILYDPNFRSPHKEELPSLKPVILQNMSFADIVRGSDEDFRNIFGADNAEQAYEAVRQYCPTLVYTASNHFVAIQSPTVTAKFEVPEITTISTIGAGDNFNAGIIYGLFKRNVKKADLDKLTIDDWKNIQERAVSFATNVCQSYDNYISRKFANRIISER